MMKNVFYFTFKALFVLEILNFCPDFSGHVEKQLDKKANINLYHKLGKNNYNTHIDQYLKKQRHTQ